MKSIKIKISELKPDPKQPRKILEGLKELGESIKLKGQLTPIIITPNNEILDGHRRYFAAKDARMEYLDASINERKLTPFLKKAIPFAINLEKRDFRPWDMAEYICDIYWGPFLNEYKPASRNDSGYTEFARYMGISPTTVRDIIKTYEISKKSKSLANAIKQKELSPSILKMIAIRPKEKHPGLIQIAKEENEKAKEGTSSMYTVLGKIKDKLKDETIKERLETKRELSNAYINRFKNKINTVTSLINETVLKIATHEQKEEMQRSMKPLIKFYNKL